MKISFEPPFQEDILLRLLLLTDWALLLLDLLDWSLMSIWILSTACSSSFFFFLPLRAFFRFFLKKALSSCLLYRVFVAFGFLFPMFGKHLFKIPTLISSMATQAMNLTVLFPRLFILRGFFFLFFTR